MAKRSIKKEDLQEGLSSVYRQENINIPIEADLGVAEIKPRSSKNLKIDKGLGKQTEDPSIPLSYRSFIKDPSVTLVGIDPSFTRTGIAVLAKDRKIIFHTLSHQIGKKDFIHVYQAAYSLAVQLKEYLDQFTPYIAVMEYAPPISSMSPALYSLDSLYHFVLHKSIAHLYHPMMLAKIIGKRDRTKADSVIRGLSIINDLKTEGWAALQNRTPCHDCLEALIYAHYFIFSGEYDIYVRENLIDKKFRRKRSSTRDLKNVCIEGAKNAMPASKKEASPVSCKKESKEDKEAADGHEHPKPGKARAGKASNKIKK